MSTGDGRPGDTGEYAKIAPTGSEGLRILGKFSQGFPFPEIVEEVAEYMAFCVRDKSPLLNGFTVETLMSGVSAWHEQARLRTSSGVQYPCMYIAVLRLRTVLRKEFKKNLVHLNEHGR